MASAGWDALTKCGEIKKRARTYRVGADGCKAGAGRVATTGHAPRDDGSVACNDELATCNDGSTVPDNGSATRNDGWQRLRRV